MRDEPVPEPGARTLLDQPTVSRKTPLDGRLEISAEAADRLATVGGEFALICEGREGLGRLSSMACTCAKAGTGGHVHHFVESPLLVGLVPGSIVRVTFDERARMLGVERSHGR